MLNVAEFVKRRGRVGVEERIVGGAGTRAGTGEIYTRRGGRRLRGDAGRIFFGQHY